jgi:carbamoylphosphate synthase small subunit
MPSALSSPLALLAVRARFKNPDLGLCCASCFVGAPKIKAMELIAQLEPDKRGIYGGAVGAFSFDGNVDTAIAIRTILMKDGVCHLQAGGGIVLDSSEEAEYQETVNKMAATMRAIDLAETSSQHSTAAIEVIQPMSFSTLNFNKLFRGLATQAGPTAGASHPTGYQPSTGKSDITLMVDNFDSFTWNIYQYLCQLGANVVVLRNDVPLDELIQTNPARLVVSPGPGWPHEAGVSNDAIKHFAGKIPILGVCLGHECITEIYGCA